MKKIYCSHRLSPSSRQRPPKMVIIHTEHPSYDETSLRYVFFFLLLCVFFLCSSFTSIIWNVSQEYMNQTKKSNKNGENIVKYEYTYKKVNEKSFFFLRPAFICRPILTQYTHTHTHRRTDEIIDQTTAKIQNKNAVCELSQGICTVQTTQMIVVGVDDTRHWWWLCSSHRNITHMYIHTIAGRYCLLSLVSRRRPTKLFYRITKNNNTRTTSYTPVWCVFVCYTKHLSQNSR